jgi:hypothetical protein
MPVKKRYYFHGDVTEDGRIFCVRCDSFESSAEHFESESVHKPYEIRRGRLINLNLLRFKRIRKLFYRRDCPLQKNWTRQKDAPNIFS